MSPQIPLNPSDEPPEEVIELLNEVDQGYVGHAPINKPILNFVDESQADESQDDVGY
jgi:hypothetical protein